MSHLLDAVIGQNVKALRGDHSQQWLADQMRERGWKWSRATVWAVESGTRPLSLSEAVDVATVVRAPVEDLLMSAEERTRRVTVRALQAEVEKVRERLMADPTLRSEVVDTVMSALRDTPPGKEAEIVRALTWEQ